jgi:hypothetical protein
VAFERRDGVEFTAVLRELVGSKAATITTAVLAFEIPKRYKLNKSLEVK